MTDKSIQNMSDSAMKYYTAREKYYLDGAPGYEEVGNTAYITFDSFQAKDKDADYYKDAPTADTLDTVGFLLYSYSQITRKGSPVENVVIDLSMSYRMKFQKCALRCAFRENMIQVQIGLAT